MCVCVCVCVCVCIIKSHSSSSVCCLLSCSCGKKEAATAEDFNTFVINMSQISLVDSQTECSTVGHIVDGLQGVWGLTSPLTASCSTKERSIRNWLYCVTIVVCTSESYQYDCITRTTINECLPVQQNTIILKQLVIKNKIWFLSHINLISSKCTQICTY